MFEYHGWLTVQYDVEYDDHAQIESTYQDVKARLDAFDTGSGLVDLRRVNGKIQLHFAGYTNHPHWSILDGFKEIGSIAPGSFGTLWIRNDEDPVLYNEFQVFVMRRGQTTTQKDTLLSPCVPLIENQDE
ncbi:immunity 7 family protein [Nocardia brasiliensis]|uniref:immunity 7 family protein n=1 Tax=Nocardia brasiliensis TaxID=37326 RepID=UPI00189333E9|nr:immunity 7 family protein [Nocardia brasiliensis]MBF6124412.1 immunity 7 family protein [Nocardia brasiliensis]MBF6546363.1 immunity 7 family protein [Nocardia brasiliensis]